MCRVSVLDSGRTKANDKSKVNLESAQNELKENQKLDLTKLCKFEIG